LRAEWPLAAYRYAPVYRRTNAVRSSFGSAPTLKSTIVVEEVLQERRGRQPAIVLHTGYETFF